MQGATFGLLQHLLETILLQLVLYIPHRTFRAHTIEMSCHPVNKRAVTVLANLGNLLKKPKKTDVLHCQNDFAVKIF